MFMNCSRARIRLLDPAIGSDAVAPPLSEREIHDWEQFRRLHTVSPDPPR